MTFLSGRKLPRITMSSTADQRIDSTAKATCCTTDGRLERQSDLCPLSTGNQARIGAADPVIYVSIASIPTSPQCPTRSLKATTNTLYQLFLHRARVSDSP